MVARTEAIQQEDPASRYLTSIAYLSPRTVSVYRNTLRRLHAHIDLVGAPIADILALLEDLNRRHEKTTMNVIRSVVRQYLIFAGRKDDAASIKLTNIKWMPPPGPSQEQLNLILSKATPKEYAEILVLYSTAARIGELCGMRLGGYRPQVSDIDWPTGRIRIVGKGGVADYLVFFPRRAEAMTALRAYVGDRRTGPIFSNRVHTYNHIVRTGMRVGVRLHPHLLRHAAAYSLRMQNINEHILQCFMRHSNPQMTARYGVLSKRDILEVAEQREWR